MGICGVSSFGSGFVPLFARHPDVDAVCVADLDAGARAKARGKHPAARECQTLDEPLDADVDAVALFTPTWTHAAMAAQALRAGKHVLCACPVGVTLDEVRAVVEEVGRSGKIYMTAETSYYYPLALYAREAWAAGRFGDFVYGEGQYYYRPEAYPFYLRDYYCNMPPILYATHSTAFLAGVTGKRFERVTCVGTPGLNPAYLPFRRRPEWRENEVSNMTMLGVLSGGGTGRINEMRDVGASEVTAGLFGTRGSICQHAGGAVWSDGIGRPIDLTALWKDPSRHPHAEPARRLPAAYEATAYGGLGMGIEGTQRFLADEFVRAVREDRRPHNHVWLAAKYAAPGIVAWESLKQNNAWLEVPDFGEPSDGRKPLEC
jgi:predicted dehydrogenase